MDRLPDHVDQDLLTEEFNRLVQGLVPLFARSGARERARGYLRGLLSAVPRKNSWQMAEVLIDNLDLLPAEFPQPVAHRVLQPPALLVVGHLI